MKQMSGKKVLVTGGAGFIGSNLVRRLLQLGSNVVALDNFSEQGGANLFNLKNEHMKIVLVKEDLRATTRWHEILDGVSTIFHLASLTSHKGSIEDPMEDCNNNVFGLLRLLENIKRTGVKPHLVVASTRQIYGRPKQIPVNEKHPIAPPDPNGVSKLAAEHYATFYAEICDFPLTILRMSNIYGPGMRVRDAKQMFLGWWINRLITGNYIEIFGLETKERDLLHIDDCVDAMLLGIEPSQGSRALYNVGGTEGYTLRHIAETLLLVGKSQGLASGIKNIPMPELIGNIDIGSYRSDISLIKNQTGWSPRKKLYHGLHETVRFYALNAEKYF